ncbi:L-threonylcarbamoyladenylate synthase [Canibacter zhoujuaniae]|uniref:L-threonylcarbamoyladenylate synthase n=1 Tax=Canibacter zhoujuaniae TaxID=2708343 RepID=UPI00141E8648|nr:L-threonylcarbamoyladenylate synthase [Canibacter zhoujuaniae]
MAEVFDIKDATRLLPAVRTARNAIRRGELIVLPTDTVYGVAADAFNPGAVQDLLAAKGRTRQSPPPVLIPNLGTLHALAAEVSESVAKLAEAFWPGPLTLIMVAQPSLSWDLGETRGTVALRMPNHELTLQLLSEIGPLAVSSANITGEPAAQTAAEAEAMLGESITVYLEDGLVSGDGTPSTILDVTGLHQANGVIRVLRDGALSREQIEAVLPEATLIG